MGQFIERCRELPMRTALKISGISVCAIFAEGLSACSMGFQSGWANGWPGISRDIVFAAFMSGVYFLMLMSAGAALFAVPCAFFQQCIKRNYIGWGAFMSLMLIWSIGAAILSAGEFPSLRSSITTELP